VEKARHAWTFRVTRSQQTDEADPRPTILRTKVRTNPGSRLGTVEIRAVEY
jgi:hypothetical protein